MPKCKLIALTRPVAGKEAEFQEWYRNTHLPQMQSLPGVAGAQRYKLVYKLAGEDPNQFLAIYDVDVENPADFLKALGRASAEGKLSQTDSSDRTTTYTALFAETD